MRVLPIVQGMLYGSACRLDLVAALVATAGIAIVAAPAHAGVPECGNIRLVDVKNCEIRAKAGCTAGCSELGVYKTACATRLHRECRNECTVNPQATCTDSCTTRCSEDCSRGVNVICSHNCYGECEGSCDLTCSGAQNPQQCYATCKATCDGECDVRCRPVVNASCYQHCVECCGGSCTAQANMTCQQVCQDRTFEDCEHEFRANCSASCSADGALFCDGRYIMSGTQLPACLQALAAQGISVKAEGSITIGADGAGCSFGGGKRPSAVTLLCLLGAVAGLVGLRASRRR